MSRKQHKQSSSRAASFLAPDSAPVPDQLDVRITVLTDPSATVARAELVADMYPGAQPLVTVTGSSKREKNDAYDPETGTLRAVARSLRNLAAQLDRQAAGNVKHAEDGKKHRGNRPGLPEALSAAAQVVHENGDEPTDVIVSLLPGQREEDMPPVVRDVISHLFPKARLTFAHDSDDGGLVPPGAAPWLREKLNEFFADSERRGKHERPDERPGGVDPRLN